MSYDKNGEYISRAFFTFKPSEPKQRGNVFNDWSAALKAKDRKKAKEILDKVALEQAGIKSVAEAPAELAR